MQLVQAAVRYTRQEQQGGTVSMPVPRMSAEVADERDALIEKMADALGVSAEFFNARDEMNSAVHTPAPVRLSPITVMVNEAMEAWRKWKFG